MKITKLLIITVIAVTSLFSISCKKSSTSSSHVKYQFQTTNRSSVIIASATSGNLEWTSGFGSATEIKFEAKSNNQEAEFKSEVPQRIDLFSSVVTLGNITLTPGTYSEVEFKVELNPTSTDPALELKGQYTDHGTTTPVIFRVNSPIEIKNEKSNVVITDNNGYRALTTLNLALLTNGVTASMLNNAVRTNGVILISSTSNSNIYNILLNNFDDSDEVEFDHD